MRAAEVQTKIPKWYNVPRGTFQNRINRYGVMVRFLAMAGLGVCALIGCDFKTYEPPKHIYYYQEQIVEFDEGRDSLMGEDKCGPLHTPCVRFGVEDGDLKKVMMASGNIEVWETRIVDGESSIVDKTGKRVVFVDMKSDIDKK